MTAAPAALSHIHRFEPGAAADRPPLLLLHGTGGDETDLIDLGRSVAPGAALLSPRGRVLENGMPRFFRRLAEGVFDEPDLTRRAQELGDFVEAARAAYGLPAPIAFGFSNGANIAAALLLLRPDALAGAALLRVMPPFREPPQPTLKRTPVLMLSGESDPLIRPAGAARLAATLEQAGAVVSHRTLPGGHGLSQADLAHVKTWLDAL